MDYLYFQLHPSAAFNTLVEGNDSVACLLFLQAMMDIDGNGRVSYDELLHTAKLCLEASKKMGDAADRMPDDVLQVWMDGGVMIVYVQIRVIKNLLV